MSFKSKRIITGMFVGVLLAAAYIIYALGRYAPSPEDVGAWALAILIFVGISIVLSIVIQILFHIAYSIGIAVKERERDDKEVERIIASEVTEDELDKLIGLKSSRAGYICAGAGFLAALIWLAFFGASVVVALHIIMGAFFIGSGVEGFISIRFYERGV